VATRDQWPEDLTMDPEGYIARAETGATVNPQRLALARSIVESEMAAPEGADAISPETDENTEVPPPEESPNVQPEAVSAEGGIIPDGLTDERLVRRSVQVDTAEEEFRPTSMVGLQSLLEALQAEHRPYRIINRFTGKVYGSFGDFVPEEG